MFRYQLSFVLALLLSLILAQAGAAYWSNQVANEHIQRGQISSQILQNFMQLSTEKQQLKIWLAEYLLIKDGSTLKRDLRFAKIEDLLEKLNQLTEQAQQQSLTQQDFAEITQQIKVISLFETNFASLKQALRSWEIAKITDDDERWLLLSQSFDQVDNTDLRQLLNQAISVQQQRTTRYESAAMSALSNVRSVIISLAVIGVILGGLLGGWLLRTLSKPLAELVKSTTALEQGQLNHRIAISGPYELKTLARHFNYMAQSLEQAQQQEMASRQLIEKEVTARTQELAQALQTLEKAKHQQKEFFANVSHELRTPATAILGEAQITLRSRHNSDDEYRQALQRINESATHLSYRIDDLLMLIRQDEQLFQPTLTAMTLETIWQAVGRQANLLANSQQVIVESTHPAQANWQTLICYTDLDKLLMIIRIIVDNALRYDPKKQPLGLTLMLEPNQVSFQLSDQGIGIANDDLERIFERYFRANNGKQYRPDGLGIGLTLAQSMAKQLNGEIKIASQLNQGSQVTLSFPLEEV
ncbi:HAMP domain-containing sensor histidine kinase [Vibrio metschnikovii]|uniref:HAMP domain-containing sensor histidine kinase n=1 Tax=Vibrio metschnikovii TaxID=28172 RepID=UPI001C300F6F|nr:HAMP domain-containing sensor histidine kinase [Vibrio metschnikovii]